MELAVAEVGPGQVRVFEVCSLQSAADEAGFKHSSVLEVGLTEVGLNEHEAVKIRGASAVRGAPGIPRWGALLQGE